MTEYCFSLKKSTEIESVLESVFLIISTNKPCLRRLALAQPWSLTSSLQIQPNITSVDFSTNAKLVEISIFQRGGRQRLHRGYVSYSCYIPAIHYVLDAV
jgi:hypothetical protein